MTSLPRHDVSNLPGWGLGEIDGLLVHPDKASHYKNLSMQYTEIFLAFKIENFQLKNFDIFSYFCSKHRLWVLVRKVQVGKDQEKAQSEKDSHSKNRGGEKKN